MNTSVNLETREVIISDEKTISTNFKSRTVSLADIEAAAKENGLGLADLLSEEGPAFYQKVLDEAGNPITKGKTGEEQYKRTKGLFGVKFSHSLEKLFSLLPVSDIEKSFLVAIGESKIRDFVKSAFIDKFLPIRDHSLQAVATAWLENQSAESGVELTAEDFKLASTLFGQFIAAVYKQLGKADAAANDAGAAFANAAKLKFSFAALSRLTSESGNEAFLNRLILRFTDFNGLVAKGMPTASGEQMLNEEQQEKVQAVTLIWIKSVQKQITELQTPKEIDISAI